MPRAADREGRGPIKTKMRKDRKMHVKGFLIDNLQVK
jgi:hypothetical protein